MTGSYTYAFDDIRNRPVAVIGAGTLGRRIALMFATRGGTVRIYARRAEQRDEATQFVTQALPKLVADRGFGDVGVVTATGSLDEALDRTWLAVESVPEKLDIKIALWGQIDQVAPAGTIFGTNSSSLPSRLMAENVHDKTRLCNMHFYMPPDINALELMSNGQTDRGLLETLLTVLPEFGVHPFEVRKESTGFIFNRVWAAIKRESLAVVAEGVARPEDIDGMFKLALGVSVGPFQMMDLVGLDVVLDIENHYAAEFPHLPLNVRELLASYIDAGKLGIKTGEGFYTY
ncbi:3-hydroxyacyl-CoA dehydrogenase family protein [Mycobacterium montefiorense]|uniref:Dehydrogenase n=1 Tax=Mycobacterium montefiorense TaxID=154654 RepID=A0AA37UX89_9MYCO|nr:3-hydroxyacyl-CoA dehydrogenase family protein [Mycobacterium montefiorense]GBG36799.1 putative dehydrogenase (3-hydroxybutyryl-CoA dehydrogenase FadB?) [Mycobacterium montefiorense]GKU37559.1 putative dehydrogenase [Mycobacterium montefiorense]GKU42573.1 putative dehydrogenase [Mycobacterium montefiorense]GKU48749.1 putative dehydrogenase [Mycobacterium montefiorense]GKU50774.1 putative dehydrogenase [Mycobacterium montefiorense]